MTKLEKLQRQFKERPTSVKYPQLEKLLLALGFTKRHGKGSHVKFYHAGAQLNLIVAVHNNDCKPVYKEAALKELLRYGLIPSP